MSESLGVIDCPVCDEPFEIDGPDGVMVHVVVDHSRSVEALIVEAYLQEQHDRPA